MKQLPRGKTESAELSRRQSGSSLAMRFRIGQSGTVWLVLALWSWLGQRGESCLRHAWGGCVALWLEASDGTEGRGRGGDVGRRQQYSVKRSTRFSSLSVGRDGH